MARTVRHVDRGAWLSVDGTREFGVSGLWQIAGGAFCDCAISDVLAEGFADIGVDSMRIEARLAGRCVECGTEGTTDWVTLGRIVETDELTFLPVDADAVQLQSQLSSG
jgi:hypothetical protein